MGLNRVWRGRASHSECNDALGCHARLMANDRSAQSEDIALLEDAPTEWRALVLPLVRRGGAASRSAIARPGLKGMVQKVESRKNFDERLLLSRRPYKSYRGFWDMVDSDDASAEFDWRLERHGRMVSRRSSWMTTRGCGSLLWRRRSRAMPRQMSSPAKARWLLSVAARCGKGVSQTSGRLRRERLRRGGRAIRRHCVSQERKQAAAIG